MGLPKHTSYPIGEKGQGTLLSSSSLESPTSARRSTFFQKGSEDTSLLFLNGKRFLMMTLRLIWNHQGKGKIVFSWWRWEVVISLRSRRWCKGSLSIDLGKSFFLLIRRRVDRDQLVRFLLEGDILSEDCGGKGILVYGARSLISILPSMRTFALEFDGTDWSRSDIETETQRSTSPMEKPSFSLQGCYQRFLQQPLALCLITRGEWSGLYWGGRGCGERGENLLRLIRDHYERHSLKKGLFPQRRLSQFWNLLRFLERFQTFFYRKDACSSPSQHIFSFEVENNEISRGN